MSHSLISRSPDLQQLRDEGYEIEVRGAYLLMHHVPYVSGSSEVRYGILISQLNLAGDVTERPNSHIVSFAGGLPHTETGASLENELVAGREHQIDETLTANYQFSRKPARGKIQRLPPPDDDLRVVPVKARYTYRSKCVGSNLRSA